MSLRSTILRGKRLHSRYLGRNFVRLRIRRFEVRVFTGASLNVNGLSPDFRADKKTPGRRWTRNALSEVNRLTGQLAGVLSLPSTSVPCPVAEAGSIRLIHAYHPRDAYLVLCGTVDWREKAEADEVTCPACLTKLEGRAG